MSDQAEQIQSIVYELQDLVEKQQFAFKIYDALNHLKEHIH